MSKENESLNDLASRSWIHSDPVYRLPDDGQLTLANVILTTAAIGFLAVLGLLGYAVL